MMPRTKKGDPGGQPTKYKEEHCQALISYFDAEPWKMVNGKRQYQRMPTITRFAKIISVAISTVYNWKDKDHDSFQPNFLEAYNKAKILRKEWLIDVGLSGLAPANSFKFVAVNCTDMRDKNETEHGLTGEVAELLKEMDGMTKGLPNG